MEKIGSFFLGKGTVYFVSQVIGVVAAVLLLVSFQQRTHKRIVIMQACAGLLFGIQYLLLGAYEGMACNFIGMLRSFSYSFRNKSKIIDSVFCPVFFAVAFGISAIITYNNLFSLLPLVAMVISSFVLWIPQTQKLRALTLPTSVMWLIYNIACGSVVATATEVFCEASIIIGLIRFREKKTEKKVQVLIRDLTKGKPSKVLWAFTLPMFLSVAFQQMYNIADSVIAGRFAGEEALAAVGASYPITMIFNAIAAGSNIGCAVVIARIFGSGDYKKLRTAVSTTIISSVVISAVLMIAGVFTSAPMTALLNTPENIFSEATLYLKIYIGGFVFLFLYNIATAIFVSLGDSQTPLVFLICSSVGNIILDYVFVKFFSWGVAGVAWATFIAQGIACIFALAFVKIRIRTIPETADYEKFSPEMLKDICKVALPSILQQSFVSVGNLFIQSLVNSFGSSVIAGYSSAIKLNTFCITNLTTLGNGVSSYTAQNVGAGRKERIEAGFRSSLLISLIITIPFTILYYFFASSFVGLFMENGGGEAMQIGMRFLHLVSPFYIFISAKIMVDGILRGMGKMGIFLVSTFADLILRVILAYILSPHFATDGIWYSWPVGWMVATALSIAFFLVIRKKEIINQ